MAIKKIRVTNFKSFRELEVELGDLNILIGANASGKSNFVDIFRFLRDIENSGLDNAISMQGGIEYLRNINIGRSTAFSLEVTSDQESGVMVEKDKVGLVGIRARETIYEFTIEFHKRGSGFNIAKDRLVQICNFFQLENQKGEIKEVAELGSGKITLSKAKGRPDVNLDLPAGVPIKADDVFPQTFKESSDLGRDLEEKGHKSLLLQTPLPFILMMPHLPVQNDFSGISIYDFDPRLPKKATQITGKAELEEDASNLAIVLKNIIGKSEEKRKLSNLVEELLPFVDDLGIEKFADKSLLFKLREKYSGKQYLPASLISDGTVNMTALIIALYFERKPLAIIEEPERNIHPYLISRVMDMMKDASESKQIIVTTHNPEMVKYADKKDVLLISRCDEGFSTVCRPSEKDGVQTFLENGMRMEELYVSDLLGT